MLKNYLKVAIRNLSRNKIYGLINIFGLTLGITVFALLWLFINHELGYNTYNTHYDRIYRIYEEQVDATGELVNRGFTSMALSNALKEDFPQIEEKANLFSMGQSTVTVEDRSFVERDYLLADPSFFKIFDFKLVDGTLKKEVLEKAEAVVTESIALKYFDRTNVTGEVLEVNRFGNVKIMAVIKDIPSNSDIQADIIYSCNFMAWEENWVNYFSSWERINTYSFFLFSKDAKPDEVLAKKDDFLKKYLGEKALERDFFFQPLSDLHLRSKNIEDIDRLQLNKGNIQYVYIFSAIGLFVLLIACINYINLATARSFERLKEVGIRKVAGASKQQLISQFLAESVVIAFISVLISVGVIEFILPSFNSIAQKDLALNFADEPQFLVLFLSMAIIIGLVSGLTPAWLISRFRVIQILGGRAKQQGKFWTRRGLVIAQFAISMIMIVATVVVFQQMEYVRSTPLGFDKDQLLMIDINSGRVREGFEAMKNEFANHPDVTHVSVTSRVPGEWKLIASVDVASSIAASEEENINMNYMGYDEDALETFGFELMDGNYFSGNVALDSFSVVLNEKAVKELGLRDPIGRQIKISMRNIEYNPRVIGIVKDFHFESLYEEIGPMVMGFRQNPIQAIDYFTLKTTGNNLRDVVAHATEVHKKFDANNPIEYHFLDEQLDRFYKNDVRRGQIFGLAAGLAILIACLGLFGLASFTAQQRTKEFGIRKVLGASVIQLMVLMSKEYVSLVVVAFLIATPISWYFMGQWLSDFAYRIELQWTIFLLSGFMALFTALITVSYKSSRAATSNPINSLRYE